MINLKITNLGLAATLIDVAIGRDVLMMLGSGNVMGAVNSFFDNIQNFFDNPEALQRVTKILVAKGAGKFVTSASGMSLSTTVGGLTIGF